MPGTRKTSGPTSSPTGGYLLRQIVLDTETTGLNPKLGDRIIELGCVEVLGRSISEAYFHRYVNPEREIELGATRIHGITLEDLAAKPRFAAVAREFLDFVRGAELIIHNADFDVEFLDMELERVGLGAHAVPGAQDLARGAVRALFDRPREPHAAWRAARRAPARRMVPGDDARPGEPDDGARDPDGGGRRRGRPDPRRVQADRAARQRRGARGPREIPRRAGKGRARPERVAPRRVSELSSVD